MITITFSTWMIPAAITIIAVLWALFWVDDGGGFMSGIGNIIALVPALILSLLAWMVWGIMK